MTGIYCIKVDDCIVYVGKSNNIEERAAQHWQGIYHSKENKYELLRGCRRTHKISFWLLEECVEDKILDKERKWIDFLKPCLNSKNNDNYGSEITANEFYNYIYNHTDEIDGMVFIR